MVKISVVVCTLNRERELNTLLENLRQQTYGDYELIIVTNKRLRIPKARVIIQKGRGLPNARNEALPHTKGEIITFFDDDVLLEKDYLEKIVKVFDRNPDIGGVTGRIKPREQDEMKTGLLGKVMGFYARIFGISGFFVNQKHIGKVLGSGFTCSNFETVKRQRDVEWMSGCNMSYRKSAVGKTGKFNERLSFYYEDADYSYRAKKAGFRLVCTPDAVVDHLVTPTARDSLPKLKYNQLRNHRVFFYDNVYMGSIVRKVRYMVARAALFLPVMLYSAYIGNSGLLGSYIKVIAGWDW